MTRDSFLSWNQVQVPIVSLDVTAFNLRRAIACRKTKYRMPSPSALTTIMPNFNWLWLPWRVIKELQGLFGSRGWFRPKKGTEESFLTGFLFTYFTLWLFLHSRRLTYDTGPLQSDHFYLPDLAGIRIEILGHKNWHRVCTDPLFSQR